MCVIFTHSFHLDIALMQLPQFLSDNVQIPCKFWAVRFQSGTDQRLLEHVIITPVMDLLNEDHKSLVCEVVSKKSELITLIYH